MGYRRNKRRANGNPAPPPSITTHNPANGPVPPPPPVAHSHQHHSNAAAVPVAPPASPAPAATTMPNAINALVQTSMSLMHVPAHLAQPMLPPGTSIYTLANSLGVPPGLATDGNGTNSTQRASVPAEKDDPGKHTYAIDGAPKAKQVAKGFKQTIKKIVEGFADKINPKKEAKLPGFSLQRKSTKRKRDKGKGKASAQAADGIDPQGQVHVAHDAVSTSLITWSQFRSLPKDIRKYAFTGDLFKLTSELVQSFPRVGSEAILKLGSVVGSQIFELMEWRGDGLFEDIVRERLEMAMPFASPGLATVRNTSTLMRVPEQVADEAMKMAAMAFTCNRQLAALARDTSLAAIASHLKPGPNKIKRQADVMEVYVRLLKMDGRLTEFKIWFQKVVVCFGLEIVRDIVKHKTEGSRKIIRLPADQARLRAEADLDNFVERAGRPITVLFPPEWLDENLSQTAYLSQIESPDFKVLMPLIDLETPSQKARRLVLELQSTISPFLPDTSIDDLTLGVIVDVVANMSLNESSIRQEREMGVGEDSYLTASSESYDWEEKEGSRTPSGVPSPARGTSAPASPSRRSSGHTAPRSPTTSMSPGLAAFGGYRSPDDQLAHMVERNRRELEEDYRLKMVEESTEPDPKQDEERDEKADNLLIQ